MRRPEKTTRRCPVRRRPKTRGEGPAGAATPTLNEQSPCSWWTRRSASTSAGPMRNTPVSTASSYMAAGQYRSAMVEARRIRGLWEYFSDGDLAGHPMLATASHSHAAIGS